MPLSARALRLVALCYPFTVSAGSMDTLFRKARRRAGLSGFVYHDARATALTRLSQQVDPMTLAKISGHRDLSILLNTYYRTTPQEIAARLR